MRGVGQEGGLGVWVRGGGGGGRGRKLAGRSAVHIRDENRLGILVLSAKGVPIGFHLLAVASPRREELDESGLEGGGGGGGKGGGKRGSRRRWGGVRGGESAEGL